MSIYIRAKTDWLMFFLLRKELDILRHNRAFLEDSLDNCCECEKNNICEAQDLLRKGVEEINKEIVQTKTKYLGYKSMISN